MIVAALVLAAASQSAPLGPEEAPWPACRNGSNTCASWDRNWGKIDDSDFTPVIWGSDQTWSIQTRALATKDYRHRPRAWVKVEYAPSTARKERQVLTLYSFDCSEKRFAILHQTARNSTGLTIRNKGYPEVDSAFSYIVPDTYIANIAAFVCAV